MGGYVPIVVAEEPSPRLAPVIDRAAIASQAEASRKLESQALLDMLSKMDALQNETQALRSQVEELNHELENQKQRQRDLYLDVDRRLREVETGAQTSAAAAPSAPRTPMAVIGPGVTATAAVQAPGDPAKERELYQQAFNDLKDGRYDQAISQFRSFLASYPNGEYSGNAQYWIGEANYVTRRFPEAEQEFRKVLEHYPSSSKSSDAGLKLGYTYYELGNWQAASKVLGDVVTKFPNSTAARLADTRLQKMRQEGH
jgi:tol-pal system protein YbgF